MTISTSTARETTPAPLGAGLHLRGVTVHRAGMPVVRDVDLAVRPGHLVAVVGPNGAGKTSLLEAVSGVIAPHAGTITLDDRDVTAMSRAERFRAGLAHVQQGRTVFSTLTVAANIALAAATEADVERATEAFPELRKRWDSPAGLLSGGEQQMVVLARALASNPKQLLVDEMSLGLAPVVFRRLLPVLRGIADGGVGVLLVEQFAHLALQIADDALVLAGGRETFRGAAAELADSPDRLAAAYLGG